MYPQQLMRRTVGPQQTQRILARPTVATAIISQQQQLIRPTAATAIISQQQLIRPAAATAIISQQQLVRSMVQSTPVNTSLTSTPIKVIITLLSTRSIYLW